VTGLAHVDIARMRDQLFFEGPERNRRLSRFWLLLPLAAVIASAGVVSDSTATVIGAMIVAPLMTPILGIVLAVVLTDRANLRRCLLLVIAGAAAVVAVGWLLGLLVPYPVVAQTNAQVAARVTLQLADLVAALATGAVGSIALVRSDISGTLPGVAIAISFAVLLLAVIIPLTISSNRIDKTTIRQTDVQAVAEHWASGAGWSVTGVTATGDQVLIQATGPNPAPGLAALRQDLNAAGLSGLDVRVSLVPASYKPLPG